MRRWCSVTEVWIDVNTCTVNPSDLFNLNLMFAPEEKSSGFMNVGAGHKKLTAVRTNSSISIRPVPIKNNTPVFGLHRLLGEVSVSLAAKRFTFTSSSLTVFAVRC